MFTKSSLTEHPIRAKIVTRAQTEQFALLSEQHWSKGAVLFPAVGAGSGAIFEQEAEKT